MCVKWGARGGAGSPHRGEFNTPMHALPPTVAALRRDCPRESSQCLSQAAFSADQRLAELFLLQLGQISCHLGAADAAAAVVVVLCVSL